jgi:hypothetical protein
MVLKKRIKQNYKKIPNTQKKYKLALFRKFGRKSETVSEEQPNLFDEEVAEEKPETLEEAKRTIRVDSCTERKEAEKRLMIYFPEKSSCMISVKKKKYVRAAANSNVSEKT